MDTAILDPPNHINLPSGISLEANITPPTVTQVDKKLAVCLHPWSWLGGQMDDPVLMALVKPLSSKNYHVLRYNSRGVGASTGHSSFTGFSEVEDLEAVVQWALERVPDIRSVVILGYSHGSLVASMHPVTSQAFPLSSSYSKALEALVQHANSNVLVVFGDQDQFTSQSKYRTWASGLKGNLKVEEVKNASHFWRGQSEYKLGEIINKWL